ncbi:mucin-3B-like [Salarias fasciatus]|uniref:mucin-3B-like n=1 Tax=Salarias fasciatus TaxID=181472 RepID=UPI00117695A1|nr:mucin-3B-like [Salarias fasciatus]
MSIDQTEKSTESQQTSASTTSVSTELQSSTESLVTPTETPHGYVVSTSTTKSQPTSWGTTEAVLSSSTETDAISIETARTTKSMESTSVTTTMTESTERRTTASSTFTPQTSKVPQASTATTTGTTLTSIETTTFTESTEGPSTAGSTFQTQMTTVPQTSTALNTGTTLTSIGQTETSTASQQTSASMTSFSTELQSSTETLTSTASQQTSASMTSFSTELQSSTETLCTDCQCNGLLCIFNVTLGACQCQCQEFVFGDECVLGVNDTSIIIDTGAIPTRQANVTLIINVTYVDAFNNMSSAESLEFIAKLEEQLGTLCKQADPQTYETVKVKKLLPGSVVADSVAVYKYPNNDSHIQFINTQLEEVLTVILNDTANLIKISQAFGNESIQLNQVTFQAPPIANISNLEPYVNCEFANYTAEIINSQWQCVGPCKTIPDYCNRHGDCHNHIDDGPICDCYQNNFEQYYGPRCELFRRGPGFYGALFGSLAGALLLLIIIIVIIVIIVKRRYKNIWRSDSYDKQLFDFEEDFFDFTNKGEPNYGVAGSYSSKGFRP